MLQSFSDRIRNSKWLGYGIVLAISIPFALWGVQAYFSGAGPEVAATVNGEEIQSGRLEQMVSQRRQMLRERFGGELPSAFSDRMLREQVLEELITREVLRQRAEDDGFRVGSAMVASQIRQQQFFQRDGQFNRELYRQTLSRAGLSPQQYEGQVREGVRLEQMRSGVADTAFVLDAEARRAARLQLQERRVAVLERSRGAVASEIEVAAEEIRAYFGNHRDDFRTPHRVRAAYVELDMEALREQVSVPEEEIRSQYESNRQQYRQAAERRASHVLIEVPSGGGQEAAEQARSKARELYRRITEEGARFEALAREHSDDAGSANQGGDLGFVGRGTMVDPFEEALFALQEPGAVSEPVRTQYGYHIIRLEEVREPQPQPFSEVRDEIRRDLATRRAERLFYDRVEVLRNTAYENPGTLEPAADALGLTVEETGWFSRREGDGIAGSEGVRQDAFSEAVLEERRNSDLIELGQRRVAVVRVVDERPPEPQALEAVREQVRERVRAQRVEEALRKWAEETVAALDDGESVTALTQAPGVRLVEASWIDSSAGDGGDGLGRRVRQAAFEMPPPAGDAPRHEVVSTREGRAVIILRDVRLPEVGSQQVASTREQRRQRLSQAELEAWIAALKAEADVQRTRSDGEQGAGGTG
jgi:peptidyl-prolyl cis-trans isomerase D